MHVAVCSRRVTLKLLLAATGVGTVERWTVRTEPDRIDELTQLGEELRDAHLTRDGGRLRELTPRRHDLVAELVQAARSHASAGGRTVTDAVADRLTETLDAALVDPTAAQMLRSGRLTSALRHVGFGVVDEAGDPAQLTSMAMRTPPARSARGKKRAAAHPTVKRAGTAAADREATRQRAAERNRRELEARLAEIDAEYAAAEADRAAAETELDANEHHIADMHTAIERLTEELENARKELKNAQSQTRRLERALTRTTRIAAATRRRHAATSERLDNLG